MKFSVNKHVVESVIQIVPILETTKHQESKLNHYALIDVAFDSTLLSKYIRRNPNSAVNVIYAGTGMDQLKEISPCLISLPNDAALREIAIKTLLSSTDGKPMLSFLSSDFNAQLLTAHLQSIVEIETPDGQHLVLRFADTRILPVLIDILSPIQRQAMLTPVANWWTIDRKGKLQALDLKKDETAHDSDSMPIPPASKPLLTDEQFAFMLNAAEADAIIERLWEIVPEHCTCFNGGDLHEFISYQLSLAKKFFVESVPDRIAYCIAALNTQGRLHELGPAKTLLESKNWQPGSLADALAELPESCWV